MTISSENFRKQYSGNDSTTVFPYDFKVTAASQLNVIVTNALGVESTKVLNTDYTVSGVGVDGGGNVTYPISGDELPTGSIITIRRNLPLTQLTDLINQTAFQAQTIEEVFDRLTMISQQLQEALDRCLQQAVSDTGVVILPTLNSRKNKFLGFDSAGSFSVKEAIALIFLGAWVSGNNYVEDECVEYSGSLYHCFLAVTDSSTSSPAVNTTHFQLVVSKGTAGTPGAPGTPGAAGDEHVKARVNFNGTGTVSITSAYNVSSITDQGTGDYNINFTSALPAHYACAGMSIEPDYIVSGRGTGLFDTIAGRISVMTAGSYIDCAEVTAIFVY